MGILDVSKIVKSTTSAIPQIYAYTTPEIKRHQGWTKIGYTEQNVHERIKQQSHTIDVECVLEWYGNAIYEDGSGNTFKDHDFHAYLRKLGYKGNPDNEWFEITPPDSKQRFYAFRETRGMLDTPGAAEYKLRSEQEAAVAKTAVFAKSNEPIIKDKNGGEFLWNAKPRFGKTLTAYELCKRLNAMKVLIVTNRPAIANSWYDDYVKFLGLESGYHFISGAAALKDKPYVKTRDQYLKYLSSKPTGPKRYIEFVSLQDLKGSLYFGGAHDKLKHIRDIKGGWDVLIIDEAHEGVDTLKTDVAFNYIQRKFTLHLSGTPFKQIANEKFPDNAIFNWTYADEQQAKRDWDDPEAATFNPELKNPYADLPKLNMLTYQMSEIVTSQVEAGVDINGETEEFAFDLNEFFSTKANGSFVYDREVDQFLEALTSQKKFPFSTPELRNELKHTFWLLERVDSAKALKRKLMAHPVFGEYEIVLAAGDGRLDETEQAQKSFNAVKSAIKDHDKTITLSVGQLTTGVTIPEWTAVLMLSNMKSAALYMQAAFRAQNPCLFYQDGQYLRKENAYVFDFDPARTLDIYESFANDLYAESAGLKGDVETRKKHIRRLLNFFPVIGEDEQGEMIELDAERVLSIPRRIRSREVVRRGFMCDFLFQNISNIFRAPTEAIEIIQSLEPFKAPIKDLGVLPGDQEDLCINEQGEVEIPEETIIGTAAHLFGEKLYDDSDEEFEFVIEDMVSGSSEDKEDDSVFDRLQFYFVGSVVDPVMDQARNHYGTDLSPKQEKSLKKQQEQKAKSVFEQERASYKIERRIIDREREERLVLATTEEEKAEIERSYDVKVETACERLVSNLDQRKQELRMQTGQNVVREIETEKKEKRKRGIEENVRDHLRGFSRTIPSFLMAYGTEDISLMTFEQDIPEEVFKEVTSISIEQFRFLRDGGDFINPETGEASHYPGHLFDEVVFDDSIKEFMRLREELSDYFDPNIESDIFDFVPPQKTNQIYTPKRVVEQMVDLFESENPGCFDDPSHTFADLYMKSGLFIAEVITRLYNSAKMQELFPNKEERLKHILTKQVYGIAPTEIIYRIAVNFILGYGKHGDWLSSNFACVDSAQLAKEGKLAQFVQDTFGSQLGDVEQ